MTATIPRISYRISEAATATGLSQATLYRLIADGTLTKVQVRGRTLLRASELEALINPPVAA